MTSFTAEWLALREPADAAARSEALAAAFAGRVRRVVDLGAGSGANVRYLAPRLGGVEEWLAVDRDERLLAAVRAPPAGRLATLPHDLATRLDELPLAEGDLVTASALLDLVSMAWLRRLAARCAAVRAGVLFALNYDGRIEWSPADESDARVRELVNRHQLGDKGFGPALGPGATAAALEAFAAAGYEVRAEPSDWTLGPESATLQRALIDGWIGAGIELAPAEERLLRCWGERRRSDTRSRLRVGHMDLAATAS
jgi:SAM-dependent methyltransferase